MRYEEGLVFSQAGILSPERTLHYWRMALVDG